MPGAGRVCGELSLRRWKQQHDASSFWKLWNSGGSLPSNRERERERGHQPESGDASCDRAVDLAQRTQVDKAAEISNEDRSRFFFGNYVGGFRDPKGSH